MTQLPSGKRPGDGDRRGRPVVARVAGPDGEAVDARFDATFTVGARDTCDLRVAGPGVAPAHLQVVFDGRLWWLRDLETTAGTYVDGQPIHFVTLAGDTEVELGRGGPRVVLTVEPASARAERGTTATRPARRSPRPAAAKPAGRGVSSEEEVIKRYFDPAAEGPAGRETLIFRRAFKQVQRRSSRRYQLVIGATVLVLLVAAALIVHQVRQIAKLRASAERIYYATRALDLQIARLEEVVRSRGEAAPPEIAAGRAQVEGMARQYDAFVQELGVYAKAAPDERVMLRMARVFGETEVNVPKGFVAEVRRYVKRWKSTGRLARALDRAAQGGYAPVIATSFARAGLPPQYLFLALQESGFDERAVGPMTRFGYAKGMWQFIPATARRYRLQVGPLQDRPDYDPRDDRFNWRKATDAAVAYVKDLHLGDAQGSGLLVMASYNWGEDQVRDFIRSLPPDPEHRNFWRLLSHEKVPRETYDYVLSIFSAAVICAEPRTFGVEVECPQAASSPAEVPAR